MKIGLLRSGKEYYTIDKKPVYSYRGDKITDLSLADSKIIRWDLRQIKSVRNNYSRLKLDELISIFKNAGSLFAEADLKIGDEVVGPEEYAKLYSLSTGSPISIPLEALKRFKTNFERIDDILRFQALDEDISAYINGYVTRNNSTVGWIPRGNNLFVVTPSNHPLVNFLWIIGCAMGYPVILRPSSDDPFTPLRLINALIEAGMPSSSFSFYPFLHGNLNEAIEMFDLSMIFGGPEIKRRYYNGSHVKVYGPGNSKIIVDDDYADRIDKITGIAMPSLLSNSGRGCINLSAIVTTKNAKMIAESIAAKIATIEIKEPINKKAIIGAFKNKEVIQSINEQIELEISKSGCTDITSEFRDTPRVIEAYDTIFLLPTVILCKNYKTPLFSKEFPFPFITVAEVDNSELLDAASNSLIVTLLSDNKGLFRELLFRGDIAKVYQGEYCTNFINFEEPHEGFISDFLFKKKAIRK